VSEAAKSASAGGRWWLQSWFPDWSGWYGTQEVAEEQPAAESLCASTDSEKALGNNSRCTFVQCDCKNNPVCVLIEKLTDLN